MKLEIRGGFLVETFPRSEQIRRRARIIQGRPQGSVQSDGTVTLDGQQYSIAYHFEPGIRQGKAVAWVKSRPQAL